MTSIFRRVSDMSYGGRINRLFSLILIILFLLTISSCGSHKTNNRYNYGRKEHKTEFVIPKDISKQRRDILTEAKTWLGTPYAYAGTDKKKGTDCSGMVRRIYEDIVGVKLPRNSAKQADFCKKLKQKDVKPGDLVFFATGKDPNRISHVGIMLNGEDFIHASTSKGVVISQINTPYYQKTFKMYGRVP